jgi:hypothetical protein
VSSTQSPTVDDSWFTDDIFLRHHYKVTSPNKIQHSFVQKISVDFFLREVKVRRGIKAANLLTPISIATPVLMSLLAEFLLEGPSFMILLLTVGFLCTEFYSTDKRCAGY